MKFETTMTRTFLVFHFVLYLFCEIPLQCNANGILGPQPPDDVWKSSIQSLFGRDENNYKTNLNESDTRKSQVSVNINSGCTFKPCQNETNGHMITIANLTVKDNPSRSTGYQWMWSVIGHPTIQAAITKPGNFLMVDWNAIFGDGSTKSLWKAIKYHERPLYSSAVMLTKLIEFNDTTKSGRLQDQNANDTRVYDLIHFNWTRNLVNIDDKRVAIRLIGQNFTLDNTSLHGTINLTLSGYSFRDYGEWLPHLEHDTRTNQVDIQLQHLKSDSGFQAPRFSLEFAIVSNCLDDDNCPSLNITKGKTTSLDDEHTPGIFSTDELRIPGINSTLESFIQWRPIVYTTAHRELAQSTGLSMGDAKHVKEAATVYNNTLLYALYGPELDRIFVNAINVTFGMKGDGFYDHTKYQAWTFTYGTGPPLHNGISGVIVLAITVMIGVTLFVSIVAIIICAAKRFGRQNSELQSGTSSYQQLGQEQSSGFDRFINRCLRWYSAPNE